VTESKLTSRRKPLRQTSGATKQRVQTQDTDNDSAMETDAVNWSTVVCRPPKTREPAATETSTSAPAAPTKRASVAKKPPAILIRPGDGKNYTDTVRTVRACGLTSQDLGASVTMRETRDGSLLLELAKGANSSAVAKFIAAALSTRLGYSVGRVTQLGVQVEVEVLDLDAVSTAAEVLGGLRAAIPGDNDPTAVAERDGISDVRIWSTRAGQQVATAKMSRYAASLITRVPIGWTMCRVRPRTQAPERCFRCQAFGHNSSRCTATDRTGACWRCGEKGHAMKECTSGEDRCPSMRVGGSAEGDPQARFGCLCSQKEGRRLKDLQ